MAIVSITKVTKEIGGEPLFSGVTFSILDRDRLALIGPNGSGKSTLLKVVADLLDADEGKVTAQSGTRILYVAQQADFDPEHTIEHVIRQAASVEESQPLPGDALRLSGQAGFTDLNTPVSALSGGWLRRLALVAAFATPAEVYLLDEPTNHLDVEGVWWLEEILQSHPGAFVICSHDRYFLQKVTTRTLEVNSIFEGGTFSTEGSYSQFIERRHAYIEAEASRQAKLKNILRRESEWARRQPKARGTKARARLDAADELSSEVAQLRGRLQTKESKIEFSGTGRKSRRLIEVEKVAKSFGESEVLRSVSFVLTPGSVVGLLGVNGSGKSTILKILADMLSPDGGRVKIVQELRVAYFDQSRSMLDESETLKRTFAPDSDAVLYNGKEVHVSSWAQRFGFEYDDLNKPLGKFSGGEKARVFIGYLMLQDADVLLLDEPTNDLDIETLEMLESAVRSSGKAFVIVSHDRFFLQEVCTDFLAITEAKELQRFGSISQWEREKLTSSSASGNEDEKAPGASSRQSGGLSYEEKKEHRSIEGKIEKRESKASELSDLMAKEEVASDMERLLKLGEELKAVNLEIEELYSRWEALEEKKA